MVRRNSGNSHIEQHNGHQIKLQHVTKEYPGGAGAFAALWDVDLQLDRGEFLAIVGKSGSGKSTLLNMLTGIDRPTAGEIWMEGTPIHLLREGQAAEWRGRAVGIVFQFFQLLPALSALENVMLPMDFAGRFPRERRARAMALLETVVLADRAGKLPAELSGGQQQRVAIARALANDPPIVAADEPTGNLDSRSAEDIFRLFTTLAGQGKTILMVTHDQDLARRASRTVVLVDGRIADAAPVDGSPVREVRHG